MHVIIAKGKLNRKQKALLKKTEREGYSAVVVVELLRRAGAQVEMVEIEVGDTIMAFARDNVDERVAVKALSDTLDELWEQIGSGDLHE